MRAYLLVFFLAFGSLSHANGVYFDIASKLGTRAHSIGQLMSKHKDETKAAGPDIRQANLAILWSISETGAMCALLGGNLIGALGFMHNTEQIEFKSKVARSVDLCKQIASEKLPFLNAIQTMQNERAVSDYAASLANELRQLRQVLVEFK